MRKLFLALLVLIAVLSSGCIERKLSTTSTNTKTNNYLVYSTESLPEDLMQLNSKSSGSSDLMLSLFEGLVKIDENGKIVPGLAESIVEGKDNITYTFKLRAEEKWSDGSNITANDFVNFFKDILYSKQNNSYASELYYIFGAEDYNKGKKTFNGVAIRAVDDKTLEIRLNSPCKYFLQILSQPIYTLRKLNSNLVNWKAAYTNLSFTGPFKLQNIDESGELTLVKNENYYGKEDIKLDKFYIACIPETENEMASFKTGKINMFLNPPVSENRNLNINGEEEVIQINTGYSLNFNLKKQAITSDVNFRRAVSLSMDREQLASIDLNNAARAAATYVPSEDSMAIQTSKENEFLKESKDLVLSKKLLLASKYDKNEKLKFIYLNSSENKRLSDAIAKDLKEDLNLNIEYNGYSKSEYETALKSGDYNIALGEYNYNDPAAVLENWLSTSKVNTVGYKDSQYDSLINKAKLEADNKKRTELLQKGELQLISDMPTIPICFQNIILCKKINIKGVYITKEGNVKFDKAYIDTSSVKKS